MFCNLLIFTPFSWTRNFQNRGGGSGRRIFNFFAINDFIFLSLCPPGCNVFSSGEGGKGGTFSIIFCNSLIFLSPCLATVKNGPSHTHTGACHRPRSRKIIPSSSLSSAGQDV